MRNKILAYLLLGLGLHTHAVADAPQVAVDIAPLHSLVSQVMEGVGQPDLIIPPESSPHDFSLRPSQATALSDADIVFWMGDALTPWLEKAINNVAGSAQKVEILALASTTTYTFREGTTFEKHAHHDEAHHEEPGHHDEEARHEDEHHEDEHHDEHGHHDDHGPGLIDRVMSFFGVHHGHEDDHHDEHEEHGQHGHGHDGIDPHAWLDPQNAKSWINDIKTILSKQDPENAGVYESNAQKATAELDSLIAQTRQEIENLGELKFIVFHDAYQYFEKRFGISASGSISLSDAEDPSPSRIAEIQATVKKLGVNCVFAEPQYDAGIVNNVFEGSSVTGVGVIDPLGASIQPGNNHYADLIKGMVASLEKCKP